MIQHRHNMASSYNLIVTATTKRTYFLQVRKLIVAVTIKDMIEKLKFLYMSHIVSHTQSVTYICHKLFCTTDYFLKIILNCFVEIIEATIHDVGRIPSF